MNHQHHHGQPQLQRKQKTVTQDHTEGDTKRQLQRHQDVHHQLQHLHHAQQQLHPLESQPWASTNAPAAAASRLFAPSATADGELLRQAEHNGQTQQVVVRARQPSICHRTSSSSTCNCFNPQVTARDSAAEVEHVDATRRARVPPPHFTRQRASRSPPPLQLASNDVLAADAAACGAGAQQKHGAAQVQNVGCSACILGRL